MYSINLCVCDVTTISIFCCKKMNRKKKKKNVLLTLNVKIYNNDDDDLMNRVLSINHINYLFAIIITY